ncbi:uncharacterized protein A1O9_12259 [Exophiala aquamarina CBS 119918]|uniref:Uncharacterized protein n=1 Tax=Exophiala aquamarina CBS 119918 TaxID=1182545 RepID=A0A072NUR7_9EURO|nr:uncharacterized protein A1O9_12259 [Exophiala aquamarina CBS 119918]KEF51624.1 hypothetical protein A1O9_12259 [Exophiala aquamarina CBS 119918]
MAGLHRSSDDLRLQSSVSHPDPPPGRPDDEVPIMVARAQVDYSDAALDNFLSVNRLPFLQVFERQIQLIRNRSQAFEDGQITVYDKVLLALTNSGTDLDHPSAIQYYCKEFLGLDIYGDSQHVYKGLDQTLQVRSILKQELSSDTAFSAGVTATEQKQLRPTSGIAQLDMAPNLAKIWTVFENAKRDYREKSDHEDDGVRFKAAKFLRDTAENILIQLKGKNTDENMLIELNSTFKMAKAMVVSLSGGKKRKFDPVAMENVKGIPRGPSSEFGSQRHTENPVSLAHRGRTRTQRPPPVLRRDDRCFDERYSCDGRYPRDRRYAEGHGHVEGYDDRYDNADDDAWTARPDHRDYDDWYPGNEDARSDPILARINDEEYGRRHSREWGGTGYPSGHRLRRERDNARRGQGDERTDYNGHGGRDEGTHHAVRGQRQRGRNLESFNTGYGRQFEGSDHAAADRAMRDQREGETDGAEYEARHGHHYTDSSTRGSTTGPFHSRRNVDSYQPGREREH